MTAAGAMPHKEGRTPASLRSILGTSSSAWYTWPVLTGITLAAALLRIVPWLANYPLHRDEALYGAWARLIASGRDPLLLTPWIDKPPLSIYLSAGSIAALGASELALRLPGLVASILTIPMIYGLARRAYGENTARVAAALLALSPFAILFAPTAFTDPWLTLWLVAAAWAALARRGLAAGLALGLAVASKQQGLLGVPLIVGLLLVLPAAGTPPAASVPLAARSRASGVSQTCRKRERKPQRKLGLGTAALGFALISGPLTCWDSLRWHNRPSFWDHSLATYGWLGLSAPATWPGRTAEWAEQIGYLFGVPALSWLMLGLAAVAGTVAAARIAGSGRPDRKHWYDLIFGAYVAGYLALHIAVTFQPWDRYLLPLVPLVCLLAARGLLDASLASFRSLPRALDPLFRNSALAGLRSSQRVFLPERMSRWKGRLKVTANTTLGVAAALLLAALGYAAWLGAAGRIPVGSDHGAYSGITQVSATLRDQPDDAIVYHQTLGWYFDYYLFDAPQERRWYDNGSKLAADAAYTAEAEPERPQWLVLLDWETDSLAMLRPALAARTLALAQTIQVLRSDGSRSFVIYRIVPMVGEGP